MARAKRRVYRISDLAEIGRQLGGAVRIQLVPQETAAEGRLEHPLIREAVAAEREACALIALSYYGVERPCAERIAAAIRARA